MGKGKERRILFGIDWRVMMKNEQEIVKAVFDAYIRDMKAVNEKHEPTIDMLEEVKNRAIKALGQNTVSEEVYNDEYTARKQAEYELWKIKEQQECEDSVSRADVFQMIKDMQDAGDCFIGYYTYDRVKNLPPVTPIRKVPREDITEDEVRINMLELALNQAKEHAESIEVLTDNHRLIFKAEKRDSEND